MTGKELKSIRMFNQITQYEFSKILGYSTPDTLRKVEKSTFVPYKFIQAISNIVGFNFNDKQTLDHYIKEIPSEIKHKYCVYQK